MGEIEKQVAIAMIFREKLMFLRVDQKAENSRNQGICHPLLQSCWVVWEWL